MNRIATPDEYTYPLTGWMKSLIRPVRYVPVMCVKEEPYIVPVHKMARIDRQDFEDQMVAEGQIMEREENECEDE